MFVRPEERIAVSLPQADPVLDQFEPDASFILSGEVNPCVLEVVLAELVGGSQFVQALPQMTTKREALTNGVETVVRLEPAP
eukprot:14883288-Heterocapsa_arctica.AAC.1